MAGMKIAHLARWLEVGGTERIILDLCRLGSGRQWVVGCQDGPMRAMLERQGTEVRLAAKPEQLPDLLADADVVNVHWLEYQTGLFAAAAASGKPVVFTLHGCSVLPELPGPVLCTSRRVYDMQKANLERRLLIPNAIDTSLFRPARARRAGPVRIIRVCRPIRCAEYFWAAVSRVLECCPDVEVKLVGGPTFRSGRIESLGDCHDVPCHLADSDIFAYAPWPHEGTLDLVVLEAMASGLACVLSDVPCIRESVQHGENGLLTPFGDAEAFAQSIIRLVRDGSLRKSLGQRAVQVARERFDMRKRVALYEAAYDQALSESLSWQEAAVPAYEMAG